MKKKFLSLLLALAMCLSLIVPVFADAIAGYSGFLSRTQYETYLADMEMFRELGYDTEEITIDAIDSLGAFTYCVPVTDMITSNMRIKKTSSSIVIDVYEGARHNTIEYFADGVKVDNQYLSYQDAYQTRARTEVYSKLPPAGYTSGTYWYSHIERDNNFELERKIVEYTTSGLCTVIGYYIFAGMDLGLLGAVLGDLIGDEIGNLMQIVISNPQAYDTNYISYEIYYYEHENSYSLDRVYECYGYFYPTLNCTSPENVTISPAIYYYHNYFT